MYRKVNLVWIPNEEVKIRLKIAVEGCCGEHGHRTYDTTRETIKATHWWAEEKQDVKEFTQACIHCIISINGNWIPRPLATVIDEKRPTEVAYMDVLYVGPAKECNLEYGLLIKDDLSSYTRLYACDNENSGVGTSALAKRTGSLGLMERLVADQSSHIIAFQTTNVTKEANIRHRFTTPYCNWFNGTIEQLCEEILPVAKSLLFEWKLSTGEWPSIIEATRKVMNQSTLKRLKELERQCTVLNGSVHRS